MQGKVSKGVVGINGMIEDEGGREEEEAEGQEETTLQEARRLIT